NSGSTLSLGGNFTNTGGTVGGSGTGRLALTGAVVQTIGGTLSTFPNLTVGTAAAVTTGPVNILSTGGVTLNGNLAVGTNQAFTLLSDANGTAFVINNGTAVATGSVTVQRYINTAINAGPGYRHYSSPVGNTTVADLTTTGFTPTVNPAYNTSANPPSVTPFPTVFSYNQSRLGLTNTSPEFDKGFLSPAALTDPLTPTFGYTVNIAGNQLVDFVGTLNNGSISRVGLVRGTQALAGYHFTGNPYPSAINFNTVYSASSGIENAVYVFKSTTQYTGTYASYVNGVGANGGSNIIPIAQGFFVRSVTNSTGTINFTNSARLTTADNTLFQRPTADSRARLGVTLRNAAVANQTYIYFEQGATPAFDAAFDASYLPASHGLDLATETSTESLSINGQPALTATTTVPLRLHAALAGTYTLAIDELANLPAGYHAYLRDALTGTYTDLATTPSVSLTLAPADAAIGRYAIVFGTATPLATASAATAQLVSLYPNPAHGTVSLLLPQTLRTGTATEVTVVDNLGRTVLSRTLSAAATTLDLPLDGLSTGIYSVQAQTSAGVVAKRLVVE
ncbi:MAG: T9SS type A sorting domain-containing protein, partial [Hymenobacter sp.]